MVKRGRWVRGLAIVAMLLLGFAAKGLLIEPPPAPAHAGPGEFDADRAVARLARILGDQRPHSVDTAADDAVRDRLIAELHAIGLEPRVQEATDCSSIPGSRFVSCSRVRNVIATIPSARPGRQLLLNAHYDSTPTGPGAGDDGLGVAVLLEVGQLLKAAPPPRPVSLLFNEGEEFGLNGAHAFVGSDPLAVQINSLINIDNRGVTGPALMHETSDPNGAALGIYGAATRRQFANSISTDFAKLIPNTTDVVFFKPRGWTLLNFGIIGNETRYHSPGDTIEALDRNSLAHAGSEALAATRAMAAVPDPARVRSGRTVFTDIGGRVLIRMPLMVATVALAALLAAGLYLGWRRAALGRPLLVGALMVSGGVTAAGAMNFFLQVIRPGDFWRAHPLIAYMALYAVLLLAMIAIGTRWGRDLEAQRLRVAAWLIVLIGGAAASLALPGATIFFLIGPALALGGLALSPRSQPLGTALTIAATLIQFVMFAELLALIEMLLIDGPLWAAAPLAALAALPALAEIGDVGSRPAMLLAGLASLGLSAAALVVPRASAERPLGFSIDYYRQAGSKDGSWGIATKQAPLPDGFPGSWEPGVLPYNGRARWIMRAPPFQTRPGDVVVISNQPTGTGRRVRMMLSPAGANSIALRFPKDAKVFALGLAHAAIPIPARGEPDQALLRCTGRSCVGLEIEVLLGDRKPITAEIFATSFGLPPEGRRLVAARPANALPQYAPDQTVTRTTVRL